MLANLYDEVTAAFRICLCWTRRWSFSHRVTLIIAVGLSTCRGQIRILLMRRSWKDAAWTCIGGLYASRSTFGLCVLCIHFVSFSWSEGPDSYFNVLQCPVQG